MKIYPFTLVGYARLKHLWNLVVEIEKGGLEGSFVECGVWKGGSAAVMAYLAQKYGSKKRQVHLFDSFEGMPEPTDEDGKKAVAFADSRIAGNLTPIGKTVGTLEDVKKLFFSILALDEKSIYFHRGWFQETLPKVRGLVGPIAILRIDADWYESVRVCLEELYDQVVSGGYVIFDDYGYWPGCRKAVDEFFQDRNSTYTCLYCGCGIN